MAKKIASAERQQHDLADTSRLPLGLMDLLEVFLRECRGRSTATRLRRLLVGLASPLEIDGASIADRLAQLVAGSMPVIPDQPLFRYEDAAKLLGVRSNTLSVLIRTRQLPLLTSWPW